MPRICVRSQPSQSNSGLRFLRRMSGPAQHEPDIMFAGVRIQHIGGLHCYQCAAAAQHQTGHHSNCAHRGVTCPVEGQWRYHHSQVRPRAQLILRACVSMMSRAVSRCAGRRYASSIVYAICPCRLHVLWHSARRPVPDSTVRVGIRHGYKQAAMTSSVQGLLRHTGYRTRRSTSGRTSG